MLKKYKPFFKCPGGKTSILEEIHAALPNKITNYSELFLGGGAVFLSLLSNKDIKEFYLNELNTDIYNLWKTAKTNYQVLDYSKEYLQEDYYQIRSEFNSNTKSEITRAKKFLYLNKNCFNGLIRYNRAGGFNSPAGKYVKLQVPNMSNLKSISNGFFNKNIIITNKSFIDAFSTKFGDLDSLEDWFFYFDPPYIPLSATSNFTSYTQHGFNIEDQENLAMLLNLIDIKGGKFLLSNSYTDKSFAIFDNYDIIEIKAPRSINRNSKGRKKIKELLIRNYS